MMAHDSALIFLPGEKSKKGVVESGTNLGTSSLP